jgi:hypothetical protein
MKELLWRALARFVAKPLIADWLIHRALQTPYTHIWKNGEIYMQRFWLFNPYPGPDNGGRRRWGDWLPSVRLHRIRLEDQDRDMHDHPWDARTIILRGWYIEDRLEPAEPRQLEAPIKPGVITAEGEHLQVNTYHRQEGDTAPLNFGEYHQITAIITGGVWTMFITWKYRGTWGFLVDGVKVPWKQYLNRGRRAADKETHHAQVGS